MEPEPEITPLSIQGELERRLERLYGYIQPSAHFVNQLEQRLLSYAEGRSDRSLASRPILVLAGWLGALVVLVALGWFITLSLRTLPPHSLPSPAEWDTENVPSLLPENILPTSGLETLFPLRVAPAACGQQPHGLEDIPPEERPQAFAGGGQVGSGEFTFHLYLVCDPRFGRQGSGYEFSEVDGLGVLSLWSYNGRGSENPQALIVEYAGFEPFVEERSASGPVEENVSSFDLRGVSFPLEVFPDFSGGQLPLRFVIKTVTPEGKWAGAALTFTLQGGEEGYYPVGVKVAPLRPEELGLPPTLAQRTPSFPWKSAEQVYPQLNALHNLLERWQAPLLDSPGWLHRRTNIEEADGGDLFPGVTAYLRDEWFLLDEGRRVVAFILEERTLEGRLLQQVVAKEDEVRNFTFGMANLFTPYRLDLGDGLYRSALQTLRSGKPLQVETMTRGGKTLWVYRFEDLFPQPLEVEGEMSRGVLHLETLDAANGALLISETYAISLDGGTRLVRRESYTEVKRVEQLPAEALALFEASLSSYTPPPPRGDPPPLGFDLSQATLRLEAVAGDSFTAPTFWYGDLYAGEYLLGRVDFGLVAGGWCDRSASGLRLAFNYIALQPGGGSVAHLHWLDLRRVEQVFDPLPTLNLISPVSWSPREEQLAFWGCESETLCGLYLFDVESNQLRLLFSDTARSQPVVWNPDGTLLAFTTAQGDEEMIILRVADGQVVYQGLTGEVSSYYPWAILPSGMTGFGRCEVP